MSHKKKPLSSVGRVLDRMLLPGDPVAGPMHTIPNLQWKTWVRLAFIEAGKDWRCLEHFKVSDGVLNDYIILPENYGYSGILGVSKWDEHAAAISARSFPGTGKYSVADPRPTTTRWAGGKYKITKFDQSANTVIAASTTGEGAFAVADPRSGLQRGNGNYNSKHYGVVPWDATVGAITARAKHDNGAWSLADPRPASMPITSQLPNEKEQLLAVIQSLDGTWHRPFTTLELAALQGLVDGEEYLELDGCSHTSWRERIGNLVPPPAAQAIASMMGETLLLAWSGETFVLSATPIWCRDLAIATSIDLPPRL